MKNNNKVFGKIKTIKLSIWERIMLWFVKPSYGIDLACGKDRSVIVECKKLKGKTYILSMKELSSQVDITREIFDKYSRTKTEIIDKNIRDQLINKK